MTKIIYRLIIAFLLIGIGINSHGSEVELTEKQKLFTEMVDSLEGSIETKWINPYTIDIRYDQNFIVVMSESEINDQAELIAKLGNEITNQNTCVQITDYKGKVVVHKCAGSKAL